MKLSRVFLFMALLVAVPIFGQEAAEAAVESSGIFSGITVQQVIGWISPIIVLVITFIVKKFKSNIPSWATAMIVMGLSTLSTTVNDAIDAGGLTWIVEFLYGISAIAIHQIYSIFTQSDEAKAAKAKATLSKLEPSALK